MAEARIALTSVFALTTCTEENSRRAQMGYPGGPAPQRGRAIVKGSHEQT